MTKLEIWLLGRFVVRRQDDEVPAREFGGRRVRTLIRVLTSRPGQLVSKDALTEALWDERLPANPVANLEVLVHRARRTLGDPSLIMTGTGGYAFTGNEGCLIDVEEFRRLTDVGRAALAEGDWESARDSLGRALEWWRGEPLVEDSYAEWAQAVRTELARLHLEALEGAAGAALQLGDLRRAVEFAEMAVTREPLREAGRLLLMRALYLSGDRAGALRVFEELRLRLAHELGVDPSQAVSQLHLEMLRGDLRTDASLGGVVTGRVLDQELKGVLGGVGSAPRRSRALARMANLAAGADDYRRALRLVELALSEAGDDGAARAEALAVGAAVDMNLGQMESAGRQAHEALTLFDRLGDRHGSAMVLDLETMRTFLAGHVAAGVKAFEEIAALFEETGDFLRSITPRSTRGHGLVWMHRPADALAEIDRALDMAVDLRHREMRCYCLWHRSEALAALGRVDEATGDAETGLRIARELNHREWTAALLRGLGIAQTAAGDLASAETTFRAALDAAAGLPLFESWAAARLAVALLVRGSLTEAEPLVALALAGQVPLALFEARVAQAELLVALQADDAAPIVRRSLDVAIAEGHLASADRLVELLESCRESARCTTYRRDGP